MSPSSRWPSPCSRVQEPSRPSCLYVSEDRAPGFMLPVLVGSVVLALVLAGVTMQLSSFFLRVLGKTGVSVIERIMGIILTGLSVQFVYDGLLKLGVLAAPS